MTATYRVSFLFLAATIGALAGDAPSPAVVFLKGDELFSASLDGSNLSQLTRDGEKKRLPRWSPDGQRIAYLRKPVGALAQLTIVSRSGDRIADITIRPESTPTGGMRFVEGLDWLDDKRITFWGSANPWNCELVTLDATSGKEVEWHLGTCGTFVRSPDGTLLAYWGPEGMGFSDEQRREVLEISEARVYNNGVQFLSNPAWSSDSQMVALAEWDPDSGAASLTVLDGRPDRTPKPHLGRLERTFERPSKIIMQAPIKAAQGDQLDIDWAGEAFIVSKEDQPLYRADPKTKKIEPAPPGALDAVLAARERDPRSSGKTTAVASALGSTEEDVWAGPAQAAPK
jgi:dipeptidyl aminopeptidase/acylaminoacyl peptidase